MFRPLAIAIILGFLSCSGSSDKPIENKVFHVNLENCKTYIDLNLSDLIDSCWLIQLETTNESILGNNIKHVFISGKYLLIDDGSGIYKFSADGKFIKKIIKVGRGPDELSSFTANLYYSESKDLLLIDDYFKNKTHFLCYNVISEVFMSPIMKSFSERWGDFTILKDSLILGSLFPFDAISNPYAIFIQDFKGNLISGIKSKREYIDLQKNAIFQKMLIYEGDNDIHVKYSMDDSIFIFKDNQFVPYLISHYKSPQTEPPHMLPVIGDKKNIHNEFENSSFMIFNNQSYQGTKELGFGAMAVYKNVYFLLDKSTGNYGIIKSYNDDFIGKSQTNESETLTFPTILPNNKIYVFYYPHEILKQTPNLLANQKFPSTIYKQLNKIKSIIAETDNPILLIGKPRKEILAFNKQIH